MNKNYLNEYEAADYICFSASSLRKWRANGNGPVYIETDNGSIRYTRKDLDEYMENGKKLKNRN